MKKKSSKNLTDRDLIKVIEQSPWEKMARDSIIDNLWVMATIPFVAPDNRVERG